MALKDYYFLATNNSDHRATVGGAAFEAANAILNEDEQTANHANRMAWALSYLENPGTSLGLLFNMCLSNPTLLNDFTTHPTPEGTDNDARFVVNSVVSNPLLLARLGFGE